MDSDDEVEYELENFKIAGFDISITTVSFLPISKLLEIQSKSVEISGQKLWCGSLGVIQYLINYPTVIENVNIVELGAGTGVLGTK